MKEIGLVNPDAGDLRSLLRQDLSQPISLFDSRKLEEKNSSYFVSSTTFAP